KRGEGGGGGQVPNSGVSGEMIPARLALSAQADLPFSRGGAGRVYATSMRGRYSARNSVTTRENPSGSCSNIQCLAFGMTAVLQPAICSARARQITESEPLV